MIRLLQWILLFIVVLLQILKHRRHFLHMVKFFFCRDEFIAGAVGDAMERNCADNSAFRDKFKKDEEWRHEQEEAARKQFAAATQGLQQSVWQGLLTTTRTLIFGWLVACVATGSIVLPVSSSLILQIASAFLILWALLSKLGYPIRTIGGKSLPERIDNLWFITLNVLGMLCLFFSQLCRLPGDVSKRITTGGTVPIIWGGSKFSVWAIWIALLTAVLFLVSLGIGVVVSRTRKRLTPDDTHKNNLIRYLGSFELLTYTISFIISKPEFIAVWLGVKSINRWRYEKAENDSVNIFLFGTLLNVFLSFVLGLVFYRIGVWSNIIRYNNQLFLGFSF